MNLNWKQLALAMVAALCIAAGAAAEDYPAKPVRLLVGFSPGSATDIIARIVAAALNAKFGQRTACSPRMRWPSRRRTATRCWSPIRAR